MSTMLSETGVLPKEALQLNRAWKSLLENKAGKLDSIFPMKIFICVESLCNKWTSSRKTSTARSRNDQVAADGTLSELN